MGIIVGILMTMAGGAFLARYRENESIRSLTAAGALLVGGYFLIATWVGPSS